MSPLVLVGAAALLLWPKKKAYEGPEINPDTGERDVNAAALGTFAKGNVVDIGDDFTVTYLAPGRKGQP